MTMKAATLSFALSLIALAPLGLVVQNSAGQSLLSVSTPIESGGLSMSGNGPDSGAYADGVRAINAGRWSDAIAVFSQISEHGGDYADAALYWKAYAENKQGQGSQALDTCEKLHQEHHGSKWNDECGALAIEIRAKSGQPVHPDGAQSDDLKLLALASLMQRDKKLALTQIEDILNSDSSEKLKQGALFIKGQQHEDTINPQIVRVSYVEGDVRISRGGEKGRGKVSAWETAVSDLPIETGFSLVTGAGRAEIEFEDASTIYLAENSVLTFNDLSTAGRIPHTDVALLAGTATLHVQPSVAGESFLLRTQNDSLLTKYPGAANLRISSYTDGLAVAYLNKGALALYEAGQQPMIPGETAYFKDGRRILDAGPTHPPDFTSWDKWVADRYSKRVDATAKVLSASGLAAPIPGLAELQGKGRFFSCEPYGTCWEPPTASAQASALPHSETGSQPSALVAQGDTEQTPGHSTQPGRNIGFIGNPTASKPNFQNADLLDIFPCMPGGLRYLLAGNIDPRLEGISGMGQFASEPWMWAICNAGSWLYYQNGNNGSGYVWVVGRIHHHPPVRWIKGGNSVAFVPTHPLDEKRGLPVNRKSVAFVVNKDGHSIERVEIPSNRPVTLLKEPPREFRTEYMPPLPQASEPRMEARSIRDAVVARSGTVKTAGIPITFDRNTQSFMMQRQEMRGNRSISVATPINTRSGNFQSQGGGYSGRGFNGAGASGGGRAGSGAYNSGSHGSTGDGGSSRANASAGSSSSGASSSAASSSSSSSARPVPVLAALTTKS